MICAACGTEIAERALICFRCGAATEQAVRRPPAPRRRRWALAVVSATGLASAGAYLGGWLTPGAPHPAAWAVVGLALAGLVFGLIRR